METSQEGRHHPVGETAKENASLYNLVQPGAGTKTGGIAGVVP